MGNFGKTQNFSNLLQKIAKNVNIINIKYENNRFKKNPKKELYLNLFLCWRNVWKALIWANT